MSLAAGIRWALVVHIGLVLSGCSSKGSAPLVFDTAWGEGRIRVVLVGDSTVASYPPGSERWGWGQALPEFFDETIQIRNMAVPGESSKSYRANGYWKQVLRQRPGYVLIQFGHNDIPGKGERSTDPRSDYPSQIRRYVASARAAGARPILVTPMSRRTFDGGGSVFTVLGPYAEAMRRVGLEERVPVIDLHARSMALFAELGDAGSAHLGSAPTDRTHFSEDGARTMAGLVVDELSQIDRELRAHLLLTSRDSRRNDLSTQ